MKLLTKLFASALIILSAINLNAGCGGRAFGLGFAGGVLGALVVNAMANNNQDYYGPPGYAYRPAPNYSAGYYGYRPVYNYKPSW